MLSLALHSLFILGLGLPHTSFQLPLHLPEHLSVPLSKSLLLLVLERLDTVGNPRLVVWKAVNCPHWNNSIPAEVHVVCDTINHAVDITD